MTKQLSPNPLFTLRGEMEAVHHILFNLSECESIFAATQNGFVHKWNLKDCREETKLEVGQETVLAIHHSSNKLICQLKGGEFKIFEGFGESWLCNSTINTNYWGFCKFQIHNNLLTCPESDSKIKILNFEGTVIKTLSRDSEEKCGEVMAIKCFSLEGSFMILSVFESGILTLFRSDGKLVSECRVSSDCLMALDFNVIVGGVVGGSGDTIFGFSLTNKLQLEKRKEVVITNPGVGSLAIRPDGKLFAAGCWDARIRLFSLKSFKLLAVLDSHKSAVQDVCFSTTAVSAWNCQYLLAAAGQDGRITLWDIYS